MVTKTYLHACLGKGAKKTANYPLFVDKRLTPPPSSTSAKVNNIHNKEFLAALSSSRSIVVVSCPEQL